MALPGILHCAFTQLTGRGPETLNSRGLARSATVSLNSLTFSLEIAALCSTPSGQSLVSFGLQGWKYFIENFNNRFRWYGNPMA